MDDTVNGERWEPLAPSKQTIFSSSFVTASHLCSKERAGRGEMPRCHTPAVPELLLEEEHSWFSHHHVLSVFTWHLSPGANVSNSPGVTTTETNLGELSSASSKPQQCSFPEGLHQVGAGARRAPQTCPPSQGSPTLPRTLCPSDGIPQPETPFHDVKPGGVLQAEVGRRAQWSSLSTPGRLVM